jgi:hypothetical protein
MLTELAMSYTAEDFHRDYIKEHIAKLTPEELQQMLRPLPLETRLAGISAEQIRKYLNQLGRDKPAASRKSRRRSKGMKGAPCARPGRFTLPHG